MNDIAHDTQSELMPFAVGVRSYSPEEKDFFYGRKSHLSELILRFRRSKFLSLVGPKGNGKSSLVNCGLLSELHGDRGISGPNGKSWEIAVFRPGASPIQALAKAMVELYDGEPEINLQNKIETGLRENFHGFKNELKKVPVTEGTNFLLIIDQFEDLFKYKHLDEYPEDVDFFINLLVHGVDFESDNPPIKFLVVMDSNKMQDVYDFPSLYELINESQFLLPSLDKSELEIFFRMIASEMIERELVTADYFKFADIQDFIDSFKANVESLYYLQLGFKSLADNFLTGEHKPGESFLMDWRNLVESGMKPLQDRKSGINKDLASLKSKNEDLLTKFSSNTESKTELDKLPVKDRKILHEFEELQHELKLIQSFDKRRGDINNLRSLLVLKLESAFQELDKEQQVAFEKILRETLPIKELDGKHRPVAKSRLMRLTGLDEKKLAQVIKPFGPEGIGILNVLIRPTEQSELDGIGDINEPEEDKLYLSDFILEQLEGFHLEDWPRYEIWSENENWGYDKLKELDQIYRKRDLVKPFKEIRRHRLATFTDWYTGFSKAEFWASAFPHLRYAESVEFLAGNIKQNAKEELDKIRELEAKARERRKRNRIITAFGIVSALLAVVAGGMYLMAQRSEAKALLREGEAIENEKEAYKQKLNAEGNYQLALGFMSESIQQAKAISDSSVIIKRKSLELESKKRSLENSNAQLQRTSRSLVAQKVETDTALAKSERNERKAVDAQRNEEILKTIERQKNIALEAAEEAAVRSTLSLANQKIRDVIQALGKKEKEVKDMYEGEHAGQLTEMGIGNPEHLRRWNAEVYQGMVAVEVANNSKDEVYKQLSNIKDASGLVPSKTGNEVYIIRKNGIGKFAEGQGYTWLNEKIPGILCAKALAGDQLVVGTATGEIHILKTSKAAGEAPIKISVSLNGIKGFAATGQHLFITTAVGEVYRSDLKSLSAAPKRIHINEKQESYTSVELFGSYLFIGRRDDKVDVISTSELSNDRVATVTSIAVGKPGKGKRITAMAFLQPKNRVLLGNSQGELFAVDLKSKLETTARPITIAKHGKIVDMFAGNKELVIASEDQTISYWKVNDVMNYALDANEGLYAKHHKNRVTAMTTLEDGKVLSCGDREGCVVWLSNPSKLVDKFER